MALHLHRHGDLATLLADLATVPPPRDPFAPHHVVTAVPGPGAALRTSLALHHGVAAHVATPVLGAFLETLYHALQCGDGAAETEDPWSPHALTWPMVDALQAETAASAQAVDGPMLARARRLAEALSRALLRAPARLGDPALEATLPAGLPVGHVRLWRWVSAALATPQTSPPPATRLARLSERLATASSEVIDGALPGPVAIVGHHGLCDVATMSALAALAARVDVHLFTLATHPALDHLQARHLAALAAVAPEARPDRAAGPTAARPDTTLGALQTALLDRPQRGRPQHDASVVFHLASSRVAQVERLRDALLTLLDADPSLEPRDIHIACPDLPGCMPLLDAILGEALPPSAPEAPAPPVLITRGADLPESRGNPLADALLAALRLPDTGLALGPVVDLLAHPAVMRSLDLTPAGLRRCAEWLSEAGVHRGRDGAHRAALGLPARDAHTFRHGFDRLLLGYALPARDEVALPPPFDRLAPVATVEGTEVAALGRCIDLLEHVFDAIHDTQPRSAPAWRDSFAALANHLAGDHADSGAWLQGLLARGFAWGCAEERALTFDAARLLLAQALDAPVPPRSVPAGGATVGPLRPLRARPARVVAILALDVDGLGTPNPPHSFDLLSDPLPAPGFRPDDESRAAVLEHVLAASERCLIFATPHEGAHEAPELALPEPAQLLLRALDDHAPGWREVGLIRTDDPPDGRWDPRLAAPTPTRVAPTAVETTIVATPPTSLTLTRLAELLAEPHKTAARDILGLTLLEPRESLSDRDLLAPDALDDWRLGERLLSLHVTGVSRRTARNLSISEGLLPPGHAGAATFERVAADADRIASGLLGAIEVLTESQAATGRAPASLPLDLRRVPVALEIAGVRLEGEVPGVLGPTLAPDAAPLPPLRVTWRHGRARPVDHVRLWVYHLALTLALPRAPRSILAVRANDARDKAELVTLPPLPRSTAHAALSDLVTLAVAMHADVPHLYPATAEAFARALDRAATASGAPDFRTTRSVWSSVPRWAPVGDAGPQETGEAHGALGLLLTTDVRTGDYPLDHPAFREAALRLFGPLGRHLRRLPLPLDPNAARGAR
jgi:exodeoxyribonuclease V gamma subunit